MLDQPKSNCNQKEVKPPKNTEQPTHFCILKLNTIDTVEPMQVSQSIDLKSYEAAKTLQVY